MKTSFMFLLFFLSSVGLAQRSFWRNTNGPYTGSILTVISDSGNYVLGRDYNGVFRSSDAGTSWTKVSYISSTSSFGIRGDLVFVGSMTSIFRSTNAGLAWTQVLFFTSMEEYFSSFCITSEGQILAGRYGAETLRSTDQGNNWYPSTSYSIHAMLSDEQNRAFAVSGSHIFLSTNGGVTWTQQNPVPFSPPLNSLTIDKQGTLYGGSYSGGVYKSTSNGQAWVQVNNGLENTYVRTVHATRSNTLFAGTATGGLYVSTDGGGQWSRCSNGLGSLSINSLSSDSVGCIYAGSSDGFYKSTDDGTSWAQINSGLANAYTMSIGIDPLDNVYAGTSYGVFQSSDHGESWVRNSLGTGSVYSFAFQSNGLGFAAGNGGVYRTTNGGQTWGLIAFFGDFNYSVIIKSNGFVFVGAETGLFRSTDSGISWARTGESLINNFVIGLTSSEQHIFAGSSQGRMFRSGDLGETWVQVSTDSSTGTVRGISIHPNGHVFASTLDGGIFRSTTHGNVWTYVGFQDTMTQLAINVDGVLFVGTSYGIFRSSDEGSTWTPTNSGLTNVSVRSIGIDSRGYAFIGTNAGAVFASIQPTTSVGQTIDALPREHVLYQNYPNPFNPSTTIRYGLLNRAHVTLTVFNTLGQQVAQLVNGEMEAGYHEVKFDGTNLASGVYLYRIQAGSYMETKKLLLIR